MTAKDSKGNILKAGDRVKIINLGEWYCLKKYLYTIVIIKKIKLSGDILCKFDKEDAYYLHRDYGTYNENEYWNFTSDNLLKVDFLKNKIVKIKELIK